MPRLLAAVLLLCSGAAAAQPPPYYPPPGIRVPPPLPGYRCKIGEGRYAEICPLSGRPRPLGSPCTCPPPQGRVIP